MAQVPAYQSKVSRMRRQMVNLKNRVARVKVILSLIRFMKKFSPVSFPPQRMAIDNYIFP